MTLLTRRYFFPASHRLHSERLDPEQNRRVFGKCNHPYGHGHNYVLEVTVAGETDPQTGLLVPVDRLDGLVRRAVLARVGHAHLNDLPEFRDSVPTTENLGLQIARWISQEQSALGGARLTRVRIEETGSNSIEIDLHGR